MKYITAALPAVMLATAPLAHESPHLHHHVTDANWLPLLGGLGVIGVAALLAWGRK
jgi:hypothetical protein